jgi:hypothetical protein
MVDSAMAAPVQSPLPSLTETERFHEYLKSWVKPVSLLTAAAGAGIGQWRDRPKEWKEGGEGYARRLASAYAEHMVNSTILFGASSLLNEDNRYVPSGQSGFGSRIGYGVASTVLARHVEPDGRSYRRLSVSRIAAFAGAALISRLWQPRSTSSLHSAGLNFASTIGIAIGFNMEREFLPGIR